LRQETSSLFFTPNGSTDDPFQPHGLSAIHRVPDTPLIQELAEIRDLTRPLESPFAFPSATSKSGHIEQMSRIKSFPYAPHQMRHTYRTHAMEAGVDFQTVTLLLNHANPHVSFNYVTRAHLLGHMREAQEAVSARLVGFR
jgi:integrase